MFGALHIFPNLSWKFCLSAAQRSDIALKIFMSYIKKICFRLLLIPLDGLGRFFEFLIFALLKSVFLNDIADS
jgi:hypothetical protein